MKRAGSRYVAGVDDDDKKSRLRRFQFSDTQAYMLELANLKFRFFRNQGQIVANDIGASVTNGLFTDNIDDWDDRSTGGAGNQIAHNSTNGFLRLEVSGTAADDIGWAEQDITTTTLNVEHVIRFRVIGDPGDKIEFQVGSTSTGAEILAAVEKEDGYHCVAFTPTVSPFYVQFRNLGANAEKNIQIDNVVLIDNAPIQIETPYVEADLYELSSTQSADVMYFFHEDYATHKLQRFGHTTWSLVEVLWTDGPYLTQNNTATTLTPSAADGRAITVTASSIAGINGGLGFQATDVGRSVRIDNPSSGVDWGWGIITARASTTSVTVDVKRAFGGTGADANWRLGSFSGTTGYPKAGVFYEQRLWLAGTKEQTQTLWASQTADFENHTPDSDPTTSGVFDGTVEDDDALDFTLSANEANPIFWLAPIADTLVIGTSGGQWRVLSDGPVVTPVDITIRKQTKRGAERTAHIPTDEVVLFVQKGGRKLREFSFSFEVDGYRALDMTRLAEHITFGGIIEMDFAESPESLVYAVRNDGQLLTMTYRREEDVVGWARHIVGGSFGTGNAVVESVAIIPGNDGSGQTHNSDHRDEVWVIVKRTINEDTKRYIEFFERDHEDGYDEEDAFYVDSGLTYDSTATTTISGLDHLEQETIGILADGAVHPDKQVNSGSVTLDYAASTVQLGLKYNMRLKSLPLEAGAAAGTALTKLRRYVGLGMILKHASTIEFGPDADNLRKIDFREVEDAMDTAVPFFEGVRVEELDQGSEEDPRFEIHCDDPVPLTVLGIATDTDLKEFT